MTATSLQPDGQAGADAFGDDEVGSLTAAAREARGRAYAPYSKFAVGAAVLTGDGSVVTGVNVENASFGLTLCAERVAVSAAVAAGHQRFRAIAIAASGNRPTPPCGACRQVLREFPDGTGLVVVAVGETGEESVQLTLGRLLPHGFGPESLGEDAWRAPEEAPQE